MCEIATNTRSYGTEDMNNEELAYRLRIATIGLCALGIFVSIIAGTMGLLELPIAIASICILAGVAIWTYLRHIGRIRP